MFDAAEDEINMTEIHANTLVYQKFENTKKALNRKTYNRKNKRRKDEKKNNGQINTTRKTKDYIL